MAKKKTPDYSQYNKSSYKEGLNYLSPIVEYEVTTLEGKAIKRLNVIMKSYLPDEKRMQSRRLFMYIHDLENALGIYDNANEPIEEPLNDEDEY